ncbi:UDP-N-acetylglucosamine 1-carboxyvinyltransferase [Elusimicrobiota bacterium]
MNDKADQQDRKIVIEGPVCLRGKVKIPGSKNAVLPILAATLMTDEKCTIRNVPDLSDITTMISMLRVLGKKVVRREDIVTVKHSGELTGEAPYDLVKKMRASALVMGALVGRNRKIKIPLPGGCAIGTRPIDLHMKGMKRLGVKLRILGGFVHMSTKGLKGNVIYLDYPSVGATENIVMAACHADGRTVIENASKEPEVEQLLEFLKVMGANIEYHDNRINIIGRNNYRSVDFTVMDDRIQAGTYLIAGCIKNSRVEIEFSHPGVLDSLIEKLTECGADITVSGRQIKIAGPAHLGNTDIRTSPYPGFPTDLQAPFTSLMCTARGTSVVSEEIFENRFLHCGELIRMGADIEIRGNSAVINPVKHLSGAPVTAMDLRGGAALIIAALAGRGQSQIYGLDHIERGYDSIVENLEKLGAEVWIE